MKGVGWVSQEKKEGIVVQKKEPYVLAETETCFHQITFYFTALAQKVGDVILADPVLQAKRIGHDAKGHNVLDKGLALLPPSTFPFSHFPCKPMFFCLPRPLLSHSELPVSSY